MRWKEVEKKLLKKPGVRKAMEESRVENELADAIIEARLAAGLTQAQLAKKIETNQASISRLENGEANPRLSTLKKLADVLNVELTVTPARRPVPEVRPSYARTRRRHPSRWQRPSRIPRERRHRGETIGPASQVE